MIDLHSHILPGFDDGARNLDDSLAMAQTAVADGITVMVACPHLYPGLYDPTPEQIRAALADLQNVLDERSVPLQLLPGSEVLVDERLPRRWRAGQVMSLGDRGAHVLVEFPVVAVPLCAEQVLFELQTMGLKPILGHPEKNGEIQRRPEVVATLVERGCLVQLDADSLGREVIRRVRQCAHRLLAEGLVHIIATDAHSPSDRAPVLSRALRHARRIVGDQAEAMVRDTPASILGLEGPGGRG